MSVVKEDIVSSSDHSAFESEPSNPCTIREAVRRHLEDDAGLTRLEATDAEIGIYNWALDMAEKKSVAKSWKQSNFVAIYTFKAKLVVANFDRNSFVQNRDLLDRVRRNEFAPHEVSFMTPRQVFPERWKHIQESKDQKEEYVYNERQAAMTDQYKCGKCKFRECVYREVQLRSCDEPVSLFITCLKCGNHWRIG